MSKNYISQVLCVAVVLLLGTWVGCGTGEYESRLKATEQRLKQGSVFAQMSDAIDLPGTPITVQLPPELNGSPLAEGTDPRRLKPPGPEGGELLPGRKATYEGFVPYEGGSKMAYYCYLAATEASLIGSRDPIRSLRLQLRTMFPESNSTWEPVQCQTPDGTTKEWNHLSCTGDQEFYDVDPSGKETFKNTGGTMEFFSRKEGDYLIMIGWRVPTVYTQQVGLAEWGPRVAGSVTVK